MWWDPAPGLRPGLWVVYALIGVYLLALFLTPRRQSVDDRIAWLFGLPIEAIFTPDGEPQNDNTSGPSPGGGHLCYRVGLVGN